MSCLYHVAVSHPLAVTECFPGSGSGSGPGAGAESGAGAAGSIPPTPAAAATAAGATATATEAAAGTAASSAPAAPTAGGTGSAGAPAAGGGSGETAGSKGGQGRREKHPRPNMGDARPKEPSTEDEHQLAAVSMLTMKENGKTGDALWSGAAIAYNVEVTLQLWAIRHDGVRKKDYTSGPTSGTLLKAYFDRLSSDTYTTSQHGLASNMFPPPPAAVEAAVGGGLPP